MFLTGSFVCMCVRACCFRAEAFSDRLVVDFYFCFYFNTFTLSFTASSLYRPTALYMDHVINLSDKRIV